MVRRAQKDFLQVALSAIRTILPPIHCGTLAYLPRPSALCAIPERLFVALCGGGGEQNKFGHEKIIYIIRGALLSLESGKAGRKVSSFYHRLMVPFSVPPSLPRQCPILSAATRKRETQPRITDSHCSHCHATRGCSGCRRRSRDCAGLCPDMPQRPAGAVPQTF